MIPIPPIPQFFFFSPAVLVDCGSGGFCQNFVTKTIQEKISTEIFVLGGIMIFQVSIYESLFCSLFSFFFCRDRH